MGWKFFVYKHHKNNSKTLKKFALKQKYASENTKWKQKMWNYQWKYAERRDLQLIKSKMTELQIKNLETYI